MANEFFLKVADVLEKTAAYLDSVEGEKIASEKRSRDEAARAVATRYAEVTGESLADAELDKLAQDTTALETVRKMLDKTGGAVEALGRPGQGPVVERPAGKDGARQAAYDRFASFLQS